MIKSPYVIPNGKPTPNHVVLKQSGVDTGKSMGVRTLRATSLLESEVVRLGVLSNLN